VSIHADGLEVMPDATQEDLAAIQSRIGSSIFLDADRRHLRDILRKIEQHNAILDRQVLWLKHIHEMIAADRFETAGIQ